MKKIFVAVIMVIIVASILIVYSTSNFVVQIKAADVKSIELFNLEDIKIKEFSADEISKAVGYYNNGKIDDSAYILMLAGHMMKLTFKDDTSLLFTSYGSQTHIVVGGSIMGKDISYHLESPGLAKILLNGVIEKQLQN